MTAIRVGRRALRRDRADRWSAAVRGAAVAVVLVGVVGSALLAQGWKSTVDHQRDERLDRTATARTVTISGALANYESALQAARSLWLASNAVSRAEFNAFARSLDLTDRYPGLQAIGWRTVVTDDQADEFVARNRADGEPTFAIRPPGRRPVYYVTTLSYPRIPSSSSLGTDARAIPSILATLERARDTGETTMSNQTTLPGDIDLPADQRPVAFELFVPVYGGGELGCRRQRRPATQAVRRLGDRAVPGQRLPRRGDDDGAAVHRGRAARRGRRRGQPGGQLPARVPGRGPYVREKKFTLGGRNFLLRYAPLPGNAVLTERTIPASLVLAMGVAASVLLGALLWLLAQVGALYREVGRLARTDSLTGVANRRAWDEELPRELARAARSGQAVCVALLDLDHFKAYNDEHGHQAGDRLLKAASAAWEGRLRKTDLLARYGGEEFAVLLPDCQLGNAMEIAERLRTAQPEGTCSIGVADWDGRQDGDELIGRADRALYAAKAGGRNQCRADTAPRPAARSRVP